MSFRIQVFSDDLIGISIRSIIDTLTNRNDMPDADFGQWVAPADLAEVMLFLCSDAAKPIHGALVPVPGLS